MWSLKLILWIKEFPPLLSIITTTSSILIEWIMAFIGPHQFPKLWEQKPKPTTKVTLNEPPIMKYFLLATFLILVWFSICLHHWNSPISSLSKSDLSHPFRPFALFTPLHSTRIIQALLLSTKGQRDTSGCNLDETISMVQADWKSDHYQGSYKQKYGIHVSTPDSQNFGTKR